MDKQYYVGGFMLNRKNLLTVGIFAHSNAGKTTLTEQILYHTKVIDVLGRVDSGNTASDTLNVERDRGISVRSTLVTFDLHNKVVQLVDTPGHIDFSSEIERAINILDVAILVVSGVEGIESQTSVIWNALERKRVPVFIYINKLDRVGSNFDRVVKEIEETFNIKTISLYNFNTESSKTMSIIDKSNAELMIELANVSEDAYECYINGILFDADYIKRKIRKLFQVNKVYLCYGGSSLNGIGIQEIISGLNDYAMNYLGNENNTFEAYVYSVKVEHDGKWCYAKILNGKLEVKDKIKVNDDIEIINNLFLVNGITLSSVKDALPGEIVVIKGLDVKSGTYLGDCYGQEVIRFVNPLLTARVKNENVDKLTLFDALQILAIEDPYLNVKHDCVTNEICVDLLGDIHSEILKQMLNERFSIVATFVEPTVIYKETVSDDVSADATYTSVSGVTIQVKPLARGSGMRYISNLSTDFMHKKYQRRIERLICEYVKQGMFGWEVIDTEVSLIGGQFDSMGSDPSHFNIAVPIALFRCLKKSRVQILEPMCNFEISFPTKFLSKVYSSLSERNAKFYVLKSNDTTTVVHGEAAFADMMNFSIILIKMTKGVGIFRSHFSGYEISRNQFKEIPFMGSDPRNEVVFVINDMKASLESLDKPLMKKKKDSRSKFKRKQREKRKTYL